MEDLLVTAILLFIYYVIVFSVSYSYSQDAKLMNGCILYIRLPGWAAEDEKIAALISKLKKKYRIIFRSAMIISLYFYFPFPLKWLVCMISLFVFLSSCLYYTKAARLELMGIKKEKQWVVSAAAGTNRFDLTLSSLPRHEVGLLYFAAPFLLLVISGLLGSYQKEIPVIAADCFFFGLIIIGYIYLKKRPAKTYCEDTKTNKYINDNRVYYTGKFLLYLAADNSLLGLLLAGANYLSGRYAYYLGAAYIIMTCVLLYLAYECLNSMKKLQKEALKGREAYQQEEESSWSYGLLGAKYNNPNDPSILKSYNSKGTSYAVNMGNRKARLMVAAFIGMLALLFSYLFLYPWTLDLRHELVELKVSGNNIVIDSPFYKKSIDINTIEKAELLKEMPSGSRTFGTANGIYATGNYRLTGIGDCKMYVAVRHKLFIKCETTSGIIIINDDEKEKTEEFFGQLEHLLKGRQTE